MRSVVGGVTRTATGRTLHDVETQGYFSNENSPLFSEV